MKPVISVENPHWVSCHRALDIVVNGKVVKSEVTDEQIMEGVRKAYKMGLCKLHDTFGLDLTQKHVELYAKAVLGIG